MPFKYLLVDWQTIADDEMIKFLENDIVSQLMHIIDTPLYELGKETMIGEHCECDRQQCVACWIQKKADTNGTMDIKRFSDSYSVLAVNEPGGERIWKRKQMLKIQCRKRTLDFKIPVVCIPCNRCAPFDFDSTALQMWTGGKTCFSRDFDRVYFVYTGRWFCSRENGKGQEICLGAWNRCAVFSASCIDFLWYLPQHSGAVSSAFDRVYSLHRRWNDRRYDFVRK